MTAPTAGLGDLAIVLHSPHALRRGLRHLPVRRGVAVRRGRPLLPAGARGRRSDVTITVTPVLADQLEAPGVGERLLAFVRAYRIGSRDADAGDVEPAPTATRMPRPRPTATARALERLERARRRPAARCSRSRPRAGGSSCCTSAATHAVLPLLATRAGPRLQVDAGLRSHRRRFGEPRGFWLPECAYEPGLERLLAEHGVALFCVDQSARTRPPRGAGAGRDRRPARSPSRSTGRRSAGCGRSTAIPSDPLHADFHRKSLRGRAAVGDRRRALRPGPRRPSAPAQQAREFVAAVAERLDALRRRARARRACSCSRSTPSCSATGGGRARPGSTRCSRPRRERGVRLVTLPEALARHEPEARPLARSTWGEGKDLRTWDSPAVADLAWAARAARAAAAARARATGLAAGAAERAARELLALQASDWAFLDQRRQAGDYPYQRATDHARALLEAIDSAATRPSRRLRNLAPDLSLAPLLEP